MVIMVVDLFLDTPNKSGHYHITQRCGVQSQLNGMTCIFECERGIGNADTTNMLG